ncbi:hypothetical protein E2C01_040264 [Portunus trituberculatus]|uniref:Uncharacterized protein n=1 Tax=Portunus trituberculatus TaxID=210409 RepID=A0A5B7FQA8_PORTR|nr:hypothetical protein [Portunus trituberculatus]
MTQGNEPLEVRLTCGSANERGLVLTMHIRVIASHISPFPSTFLLNKSPLVACPTSNHSKHSAFSNYSSVALSSEPAHSELFLSHSRPLLC